MKDIFGLLENDNIGGKFDPDNTRKMNSILDLFLKENKRSAMEDVMSNYLFTVHWMKSLEELKSYKETYGDLSDLNETLCSWANKQRSKKKKKS